jgi:hypothetical protein
MIELYHSAQGWAKHITEYYIQGRSLRGSVERVNNGSGCAELFAKLVYNRRQQYAVFGRIGA